MTNPHRRWPTGIASTERPSRRQETGKRAPKVGNFLLLTVVAPGGDFAQILQDANLNKCVIVSKMGFTGPGRSYAESKNIGLVELRKPLDKDWDGYIERFISR